jgi:hypothetical protein
MVWCELELEQPQANLARRLLVAFGEHRERFPNAAAFQEYAGVAPITEGCAGLLVANGRHYMPHPAVAIVSSGLAVATDAEARGLRATIWQDAVVTIKMKDPADWAHGILVYDRPMTVGASRLHSVRSPAAVVSLGIVAVAYEPVERRAIVSQSRARERTLERSTSARFTQARLVHRQSLGSLPRATTDVYDALARYSGAGVSHLRGNEYQRENLGLREVRAVRLGAHRDATIEHLAENFARLDGCRLAETVKIQDAVFNLCWCWQVNGGVRGCFETEHGGSYRLGLKLCILPSCPDFFAHGDEGSRR